MSETTEHTPITTVDGEQNYVAAKKLLELAREFKGLADETPVFNRIIERLTHQAEVHARRLLPEGEGDG